MGAACMKGVVEESDGEFRTCSIFILDDAVGDDVEAETGEGSGGLWEVCVELILILVSHSGDFFSAFLFSSSCSSMAGCGGGGS